MQKKYNLFKSPKCCPDLNRPLCICKCYKKIDTLAKKLLYGKIKAQIKVIKTKVIKGRNIVAKKVNMFPLEIFRDQMAPPYSKKTIFDKFYTFVKVGNVSL